MIGLESPTEYDPALWRAHIAALRNHPDYPWRGDDIARAEATLEEIETSLAQTGNPPIAMDRLKRFAAQINDTP